jgi:hypothetical protein
MEKEKTKSNTKPKKKKKKKQQPKAPNKAEGLSIQAGTTLI